MPRRKVEVQRGVLDDALLSAAARLFAQRGYRATTLSDIAQALSVKKASLYYYLETKEDLLTAIYQRIFDQIEEAVTPVEALDLPPSERLRRMIHKHLEVVAAQRDMLAVTFQEEAELTVRHQKLISRRKRRYEKVFESVILEGQRLGEFRPVPSRLAVFALLGMCNWLYKWYRPHHVAGEVASVFAVLFESGLRADDAGTIAAWPRPANLDEAMEGMVREIEGLRETADRLTAELDRAKQRLRDGLAPISP
jgi:AcrR family transcriptional regulator